ncbi:MAG TPA: NAD-dependent epimerase/dehydratase family protein [Caulobacteraceae bacterium]|jgi:nucleoside-diphosphate-sugar epimerase
MSDAPALETPVLVTGATSLIGRFAVPRLRAMGIEFHALSRTAPDAPGWVRGWLGDPDLTARLPECPTVLSLSPVWHLPPGLDALKARGMRRLVAFSSTSVMTKAASPDACEQGMVRRLADGEEAVRAFCAANGVAWTILRPTLIYAEGQDQNVSRLARMIRKLGFLPLAGKGGGLRQPVHADDLAAAAIAAASSPVAVDKTYALPGGETLTYRAMAERVFEGMGRRPLVLPVPEGLWRLAFAAARPLLPGATAQMGARMSEDLTFDGSAAAIDFGWNSRPFRPDFKMLR